MKKTLVLMLSALFLLGGGAVAFAGTPNLLNTTWQGSATIVGLSDAVTTFDFNFTVDFQNGRLFAGTGTLVPSGETTSFTGYIAKDKRVSLTIKSLNDDSAVALSLGKWNGKTINGDLKILPISATGFFSVKKQAAQ